MNKTQLAAAAMLLAAIAAGYGLYSIGLQRGRAMQPSAPAAMSAMPNNATAASKQPLYWHDPMYPTQKFDKPGKSPFMDMQLVPVYRDGGGDGGGDDSAVTISPGIQQNLGMRTAAVTRGKLAPAVVAAGSVVYDERDVAVVQARSNGYVERLYVKAPFDAVKKGQPLLALYVPDWIAAQEEFLSAKRLQGGTEALVDAARQRMRLSGMSDEQIHGVEANGAVQARITLTAPASGVVSELDARVGMTVVSGAALFRINGLATVWLLADIPESAAARVAPGAAVEARTPALPGTIFKGRVNAILPQVDVATRTLKVRIELANPGGRLVPGMFASVNVTPADSSEVLLVPSEAIIQTGTRSVVMTAQANGKFLPADVETGAEANGQTEIRSGLSLGQQVVVSGQFLIDSDASLRGTATRMNATPPISAPPNTNTNANAAGAQR